jgi:hypothetical protein
MLERDRIVRQTRVERKELSKRRSIKDSTRVQGCGQEARRGETRAKRGTGKFCDERESKVPVSVTSESGALYTRGDLGCPRTSLGKYQAVRPKGNDDAWWFEWRWPEFKLEMHASVHQSYTGCASPYYAFLSEDIVVKKCTSLGGARGRSRKMTVISC